MNFTDDIWKAGNPFPPFALHLVMRTSFARYTFRVPAETSGSSKSHLKMATSPSLSVLPLYSVRTAIEIYSNSWMCRPNTPSSVMRVSKGDGTRL